MLKRLSYVPKSATCSCLPSFLPGIAHAHFSLELCFVAAPSREEPQTWPWHLGLGDGEEGIGTGRASTVSLGQSNVELSLGKCSSVLLIL